MRVGLWTAFLLVSNVLGVETFRAAITLPREDALWPSLLTVPLVGLTAFGVTRVLRAWHTRDE
jgi:hypothetical protein